MIRTAIHIIFFTLLCFQSLNIKAQCCHYKLSMRDTYGDGWNGATIEVLVNKLSQGTYSAINFGNMVELSVCSGDTLDLIYKSGMYEEENYYILQDSSWNLLFRAGPNPDTGLVFSTIGDCNTPLLPGSHPCIALPLDSIQCVFVDNTGFPGSGLVPNCSSYGGGDIWYKMQVPASGSLSIETFSGSIDDTGIAAWTGDGCPEVRIIGCDDDGGGGYLSYLLLYDLVPGDTLYIQAWKYGGGGGTFEMCIKDLGKVILERSELPIVMISTLGQTIIDEEKVNCEMEIKYNGPGTITSINDASNVYSGRIGIEIRGASSSGYPQRPYGIETRDENGENLNVSILGMPPENDWVLISNYNDRSLLKNILAYKLFGEMGNYSPRAQLCEVLIDSSYRGIYMIGEKIKRDKNRVDIANLQEVDIAGDELTGGYILQQNYWNENNSFQSNYSPIDHPDFDIHFLYEYPDEFAIRPAQKTYIAGYIDSLETALYGPDFAHPVSGYRKYLDVKSFIDYFLVNEVSRNADGFKKSVFYHKDKYSKGGKLKAGPVWDFDWAWKNLDTGCHLYAGYSGAGWAHHNNDCPTDNYSTGWYIRLLQDSTFANELRCAYEDYRRTILDTAYLFGYIDSMKHLVENAKERHFQKWPILGKSGPAPDYGDVATTYHAELDSLKNWIHLRLQWLDANIPGVCRTTYVTEANLSDQLVCSPNPANNYLMVDYFLPSAMHVSVKLYDHLGSGVLSVNAGTQSSGDHSLKLETGHLPPGMYILKFGRGEEMISKKIVITE